MYSYHDFIKTRFDDMKRKDPRSPMVALPILDAGGSTVAFLRPVTADFRQTLPEIVPLLGRWRRENPTISDSIFEITDERTAAWLDKLIIGRDDRLLFMIDDLQNQHIGHIAYSSFDFEEQSAEIDSVLRGEKLALRGIMTLSVQVLIEWGITELKLEQIYLSVAKGNTQAINLYERCGFIKLYDIPLVRRELPGEVRWDPSPDLSIRNAERYSVKMKYTKIPKKKPISVNANIKDLMRSEIRNMSNECDRVGGINLSQGICDFPLESALLEGAVNAMKEGHNHYTRHDGVAELRNAIARKASDFNNLEVNPDRNIVVTSGSTGAFYCACYALLSPGDEVILFEPYYGYHDYTLRSLSIKPVYVKMSPPDWVIDFARLEQVVTKKTKGIMINTPQNPTGKVFNKEELDLLADFCIKYDLIVFTDEIYEYITYDTQCHISPASLPKFRDRTLTISGYSKTFSITGWRIGYCIGPEEYIRDIGLASDLIYVCAPAPLQYAVAQAIDTLDRKYYDDLKVKFYKKREMICSTLEEIGLHPYRPQGAYYVLADIRRLEGETSKNKAMWMLGQCGVAMVPGSSFYHNEEDGKSIGRFCFAKEENVIAEACLRLRQLKLNH